MRHVTVVCYLCAVMSGKQLAWETTHEKTQSCLLYAGEAAIKCHVLSCEVISVRRVRK
jgi:hypothetical protein